MARVIKEAPVNNTQYTVNEELMAKNDHKIAIWGFLVTQYDLKAGLQKVGPKGDKAAVKELTLLHVMNTWTSEHMHELT